MAENPNAIALPTVFLLSIFFCFFFYGSVLRTQLASARSAVPDDRRDWKNEWIPAKATSYGGDFSSTLDGKLILSLSFSLSLSVPFSDMEAVLLGHKIP
jgi:hypothetical protein